MQLETLKGRRQIDLEFENSSMNSDKDQQAENDKEGFNHGKAESLNIIDKLLSERDSQFSNFNEKIDRLRNGHSSSSFKEHRRGVLNETTGYHSSTSKPKLHRVQEINWSKHRFVLSAKNQQQRREHRTLLKSSVKKPSLRVMPTDSLQKSEIPVSNSTKYTKSNQLIGDHLTDNRK